MLLQTLLPGYPLRRALVASIIVHAFIAFLVPFWVLQQSQGPESIETLSFARLIHVQIRRRADARPLRAALPRTAKRSPKVSFARSELSAKNHNPRSRPTPLRGPQGLVAAAPRKVQEAPATLVARAAPQQIVKDSTLQRASAPSPHPASTSDVNAAGSGTSNRGGVSPFGAEQPPVLDPRVKTALLQRFNVHVTLIITVDEEGHTKAIEFQPPIDPKAEETIRTMLADATWDAAVCGGGVSCQGIATIKL